MESKYCTVCTSPPVSLRDMPWRMQGWAHAGQGWPLHCTHKLTCKLSSTPVPMQGSLRPEELRPEFFQWEGLEDGAQGQLDSLQASREQPSVAVSEVSPKSTAPSPSLKVSVTAGEHASAAAGLHSPTGDTKPSNRRIVGTESFNSANTPRSWLHAHAHEFGPDGTYGVPAAASQMHHSHQQHPPHTQTLQTSPDAGPHRHESAVSSPQLGGSSPGNDPLAKLDGQQLHWTFCSAYALYTPGLLPRTLELARQVRGYGWCWVCSGARLGMRHICTTARRLPRLWAAAAGV